MSADPAQEYFADGITEDIITTLARSKWFFVIARNSTFVYKGKGVDIRQVGSDLGVRYVLEGSVRKSGSKLRITGQLIETENGRHVWAEKYDGNDVDVFDLQDRITENVSAAIVPRLRALELERSGKKPTSSLRAYDHVLRAMPNIGFAASRENMFEAIAQLKHAIMLDPSYTHAQALLAITHATCKGQGWSTLDSEAEGLVCAERAIAAQTNDPETQGLAGMALALLGKRIDEALRITERAYSVSPNSFAVASPSGWVNLYSGRAETSLQRFRAARRLNPIDPLGGFLHSGISLAHFALGEYEEGAAAAERAILESPHFAAGYRSRVANLVALGRLSEARDALTTLLEVSLHLTQRSLPGRGVFPQEFWDRYIANFRAAGLPE